MLLSVALVVAAILVLVLRYTLGGDSLVLIGLAMALAVLALVVLEVARRRAHDGPVRRE